MSHIKLVEISKVFGPNSQRALQMMEQGASKEEVQKQTGATIGVYKASIEIQRAETFVIMGLSGSGKSTLLRCINRIHEPSAGAVYVDGTDITKLDRKALQAFRRQAFGMVFQRFALFPHRSVIRNVEYGLEVKGVPREERLRKAEEVLELVGLAGWGSHKPSELSGGMQQRVGLARALAVDPDILLMDEAFSALDPLIKKEMQDELLTLQSRMQKTIVFITHDLDEALKLGDRIAVMKDGQVVQVGTPEEIVSNPANDYVSAFTAGVDRSKVLTAGAIMKSPEPVLRAKDGPQTALSRMRRHGISSIFQVADDGTILGLLSASAARAAADEGKTSVNDVITKDFASVHTDEPLQNVMAAGNDERWPLAVVNDQGQLRGVIVKGALLAALTAPTEPAEPTDLGSIDDAKGQNAGGSDHVAL